MYTHTFTQNIRVCVKLTNLGMEVSAGGPPRAYRYRDVNIN
jgi:hypothetical protein